MPFIHTHLFWRPLVLAAGHLVKPQHDARRHRHICSDGSITHIACSTHHVFPPACMPVTSRMTLKQCAALALHACGFRIDMASAFLLGQPKCQHAPPALTLLHQILSSSSCCAMGWGSGKACGGLVLQLGLSGAQQPALILRLRGARGWKQGGCRTDVCLACHRTGRCKRRAAVRDCRHAWMQVCTMLGG